MIICKYEAPTIDNHNPDPSYLRGVISKISDKSLFYGDRVSVRAVARRIGVPERSMQKYISNSKEGKHSAPYVVQYALEALAQKHYKEDEDIDWMQGKMIGGRYE